MTDMRHLDFMGDVAKEDVAQLHVKEATYQGSWKKRGGVGAFMMLARKMDRIEVIVQEHGYDVFAAIRHDTSGDDGTMLAEVRDLRRYLLLVEAEMMMRAAVGTVPKTEHPAPFGYESKREHHTDEEMEAIDRVKHPRHPYDCTNGEYESIKNLLISHGRMLDRQWGQLYVRNHSTGRWDMIDEYKAEYGR